MTETFKSKNLEDVTASAVINHEEKKIAFTVDDVEVTAEFGEYDGWGSINVDEYTYDFHIMFDETLGLWLYGLKPVAGDEGGKVEVDVDNELFVSFTQIGDLPEDL